MSIPEPTHWNGDDEDPLFHRERTASRDPNDLRGLMCQREGCTETMKLVYTLAEHGAYCSERCRTIVREAAEAAAAQKRSA